MPQNTRLHTTNMHKDKKELFYFYFMYFCVSLSVYMCIMCMQEPAEVRRASHPLELELLMTPLGFCKLGLGPLQEH